MSDISSDPNHWSNLPVVTPNLDSIDAAELIDILFVFKHELPKYGYTLAHVEDLTKRLYKIADGVY